MNHFTTILLFLTSFVSLYGVDNRLNVMDEEYIDLTPNVYYYIDNSEDMSFQMVENFLEKNQFTPSESIDGLNFGASTKPIWVSFELFSAVDFHKILHLKCPYLYYVDLYVKNGGEWRSYTPTGKKRPLKNRGSLIARNFAWELDIISNEPITILMKVQSNAVTLIPLSLESEGYYFKSRTLAELLYGIYFGILIVMIIYNSILYFTLKEKSYLYYVLSILGTLLLFSSANGFLGKYIFPYSWQLSYFTPEIFMVVTIVPMSFFTITFLELQRYSKFMFKFLMLLCYLTIPLLLFVIFTESSTLASMISGILGLSLLSSGIITWVKGNIYAKYFVVSWLPYLLGVFCVVARNINWFPSNFYTDNGAEIGSAIGVCSLAFSLAYKYKKLRIEKHDLVKKHLNLAKNQNAELESQVNARTKELNSVVEELTDMVCVLNDNQIVVEQKNQNITASINYALHIQQAILPDYHILKEAFVDFFMFYKPKDIVSGDFLFFELIGDKKIMVVADCTGHGVPGAFMSMIGHNLLNEIVKTEKETEPHLILEKLDFKMSNRLRTKQTNVQDGMELVVIQIDEKQNTLKFAGAKNGLLLIDINNNQSFYKGNKRSIGDTYRKTEPFTSLQFDLDAIDWCYLYTDGFQDQFGEVSNKKYYSKNLKKHLKSISVLDGISQFKEVKSEFNSWKGNLDQLDDVTVVGFKV